MGVVVEVWRDDGSHQRLLRALVDAAFGARFTDDDWDHSCGGWRIALFDDGVPLAHAAVTPRRLWIGDEEFAAGYVEAVAVAPTCQRIGLGTQVMQEVGRVLGEHHDVGFLSTGSPAFYKRLGWERWRGPSFVLDGDARRRTADEDDGLMVLRLGVSAAIDVGASVTCEARLGDDW